MRKTLYDALKEYAESPMVSFHMPGHKGHPLYGCGEDITEIHGFDDLHHPQGCLKEVMTAAARLWQSENSFLLVNGSTCGILAGIRSATRRGDKVLVARNCHKSVYHAMELWGLRPCFLLPPLEETFGINGSVPPAMVEEALKKEGDIALVIVTSPTYEGVISDIRGIAAAAHRYNIPLLVDEAHGAHLGFAPCFQGGAVAAGADIVIQSLHKTLLSLTQTAICHVNGTLVDPQRVMRELNVFETSSPSYLLMASMDRCFAVMEEKGESLFQDWQENLAAFSHAMKDLNYLQVISKGNDTLGKHPAFWGYDPSKIMVFTGAVAKSAQALNTRLREEYRIETEMCASNGIVAMTGLGDTAETLSALAKALLGLEREVTPCDTPQKYGGKKLPKAALSVAEAMAGAKERLPFSQAAGRVSGDYLWAYPPGIPLIVPGEVFEQDLLSEIALMAEQGVTLIAPMGGDGSMVEVLRNAE